MSKTFIFVILLTVIVTGAYKYMNRQESKKTVVTGSVLEQRKPKALFLILLRDRKIKEVDGVKVYLMMRQFSSEANQIVEEKMKQWFNQGNFDFEVKVVSEVDELIEKMSNLDVPVFALIDVNGTYHVSRSGMDLEPLLSISHQKFRCERRFSLIAKKQFKFDSIQDLNNKRIVLEGAEGWLSVLRTSTFDELAAQNVKFASIKYESEIGSGFNNLLEKDESDLLAVETIHGDDEKVSYGRLGPFDLTGSTGDFKVLYQSSMFLDCGYISARADNDREANASFINSFREIVSVSELQLELMNLVGFKAVKDVVPGEWNELYKKMMILNIFDKDLYLSHTLSKEGQQLETELNVPTSSDEEVEKEEVSTTAI